MYLQRAVHANQLIEGELRVVDIEESTLGKVVICSDPNKLW